MVKADRKKRRRKPKPSGRKVVMVRHGDKLPVSAESEINVHIRHGEGRRVWLEVVPVDPSGPQDDRRPQ